MDLFMCVLGHGGCGYVGKHDDWTRNDHELPGSFCPKCKVFCKDKLLHDGNFDDLTKGLSEEAIEEIRKRLDEKNALVHGSTLLSSIEAGFISKDRLTVEQKEELVK